MPLTTDAGLVRAIGARQLTASIVNVTIGAGIFVLPAVACRARRLRRLLTRMPG
jgi:hypothetical protein